MNMNNVYRYFRENIRDTEDMKTVYRAVREARDAITKQTADEVTNFIEAFKALSLQEKLDLLVKLYELLMKEGE